MEKTNPEITERVRAAHKKLPILFEHINSNSKLTYPFKYDCISREFMYPELERQLRKNIGCGNGKARATGFAIPVLGRLPQIYVDTYLIKCRLQMALWLLDNVRYRNGVLTMYMYRKTMWRGPPINCGA